MLLGEIVIRIANPGLKKRGFFVTKAAEPSDKSALAGFLLSHSYLLHALNAHYQTINPAQKKSFVSNLTEFLLFGVNA